MKSDFSQPSDIDAVTAAFPARVLKLMPSYASIPDEFKRQGNPWVRFQQEWFYSGLKSFPSAKPGIDAKKAARHLRTIQGSYEPKHEHKEAAVAYLASLWLEPPKSATP